MFIPTYEHVLAFETFEDRGVLRTHCFHPRTKSVYLCQKMRTALFLIIVMLTSSGCSTDSGGDESLDPQTLTGEDGGLRGAAMGDNIRTIMAREANNIVHQMPDELTARIPINQKDSTYYDITYNFNDSGLYVIDMDIYPKDSSDGRIIFDQFSAYYNRRYGKALQEGGLFQWETYSSRQTIVEITISDQALGRIDPTLSITFFEHQE